MEKLNIAEILRHYPKGMELNCTCADNVVFDKIIEYDQIKCVIGECRDPLILDKYGRLLHICCPKCVIFPKGKTTWEGFQRPFKDGDVIFTHANCLKVGVGNTWISIYKENRNGGVATYVDYAEDGDGYYSDLDGDKAFLCMEEDILRQRFATEEEKQKLFDAIKANGYKWNAETKTLEKLIEPKFKVGDRVISKMDQIVYTIKERDDVYFMQADVTGFCYHIPFDKERYYELVPNKFDITTLKPFESRVLTRVSSNDVWKGNLFGYYKDEIFHCVGYCAYRYCIPYEGNEHLLGTTNDCDDFYKTWE